MDSCKWQAARGPAASSRHEGRQCMRLWCALDVCELCSTYSLLLPQSRCRALLPTSAVLCIHVSLFMCACLRCRYVQLNTDPAELPSDEYAFNEPCGSRILSAPSLTSARSSAAVGADGKRTGPKAPQARQAGSLLQRQGPPP